ncbi:MAG: hypothetical protein ACI81I_000087 [Arcobacteraceae bacterium]|jgi:hypothetical protein
MIILDFKTNENIEISTPKELKKLLKFSNPKMLSFYKKQMEVSLPHIEIQGMGSSLKIYNTEKDTQQNVQ